MAFDIAKLMQQAAPGLQRDPASAPEPAPAPRSTDGRLVYAVGDIHGRYDLLKDLLAQILADRERQQTSTRPMLIFCGDYIDRGPQSAEVVEAVIWLSAEADFEVRALKGNHEEAVLDYLDDPVAGSAWLPFGGVETLQSYGVEPPPPNAQAADHLQARDRLLQRMPASHLRFFEELELMVTVGDYAVVHAGIRPGVALGDQQPNDLLWIRRDFLDARGPFERVIVHGHSWSDERPQLHEHRIGIDTGAHATGVLTAVRLGAGSPVFIQTGLAPN